ncbi:MAG: hypothetical protein O7F74_01560 [Bacteroidetes bacterium]|nr:hypothetical protein [Bacteroidota bacterium]
MSHLKTLTRKVQEKDEEALKNNGFNLSISIVLMIPFYYPIGTITKSIINQCQIIGRILYRIITGNTETNSSPLTNFPFQNFPISDLPVHHYSIQ